jgi:hypothetical protein
MSRAELLELCKQRGLKATAWRKERMAAELAKLNVAAGAGAAAPEEGPDAGDDEGQSERETTAAENPSSSPRLTGWCSRAPMWSMHHLPCREKLGRPGQPQDCGCACHDPDWVRPPYPEGARLSKFNPDNDKKDTL